MTIYIGADHNGFALKADLATYLKSFGVSVTDVGDKVLDPADDFPVFAAKAVHAMLSSQDKDARCILLCGSGQGMLIAANRFKGVRAGLGWSVKAAKDLRNDEDCNVLALPSELLLADKQKAYQIVDVWLKTPFAAAARYIRRNRQLDELV